MGSARWCIAAVLVLASSAPCSAARGNGQPSRAEVRGRQLIVNNEPFMAKGICYSPVPINESVYFAPYGDYFTLDYSFIWLRDLPKMKAMGANVVRTYGWQTNNDHSAFLDAAHANDLYVMATFFMGEETETPVNTKKDRDKVLANFRAEVAKYAGHPALLFWSFGNELNGVWNGYLQSLNKDPGQPTCGWNEKYDDLGGCWIHKGVAPLPGDPCYESSYCVYKRLFGLIGDAAAQAKEVADVLVVSAFADVDGLYDKVARAGHHAEALDAWTAQVYRGSSFGDFFASMGNSTDKPVLLTEYGVDAYHDVCGTNNLTLCTNSLDEPMGSFEDEEAQAEFARNLTREIVEAGSAEPRCVSAHRGDQDCICIGGFLMSWADEYWKGAKTPAACDPTKGDPHFSPKHCTEKAHDTCGNWDASDHDLCGYPLEAAPDHYVNEEWFGITAPSRCGDAVDALRPRATYWTMRALWGGMAYDASLFETCDDMLLGRCVDLGDGGHDTWRALDWMLGAGNMTEIGGKGRVPCSGRGTCTSDWGICGPGAADEAATPCCACDFGFAGPGCTELDARMYFALGGAALLALLVLAMALINIWSMITARSVKVDALNEPLI